jgi:hypothetical protein
MLRALPCDGIMVTPHHACNLGRARIGGQFATQRLLMFRLINKSFSRRACPPRSGPNARSLRVAAKHPALRIVLFLRHLARVFVFVVRTWYWKTVAFV